MDNIAMDVSRIKFSYDKETRRIICRDPNIYVAEIAVKIHTQYVFGVVFGEEYFSFSANLTKTSKNGKDCGSEWEFAEFNVSWGLVKGSSVPIKEAVRRFGPIVVAILRDYCGGAPLREEPVYSVRFLGEVHNFRNPEEGIGSEMH